jgi:phosphatidylserine decarboxylase
MLRIDETLVRDRASGERVVEQVFGGGMLALTYQNAAGRRIGGWSWLQRLISRAVGAYQASAWSRRGIAPFVAQYGTRLAEFREPPGGFRSFNDFFIRQLAAGARSFPSDPALLGAPAEGRLSVFPIREASSPITIKGVPVSIAGLVDSAEISERCVGGYAFVFRLCPVDYHRFHFPDGGIPGGARRVPGVLHSVHVVAQRVVPDLFLQNERQVAVLESDHFGKLVLIDVGAMCVGTIIQTYTPGRRVERGDEKGYFAFGGSTTILLSERDRLIPDADLLASTASGIETLVRVGEPIARRA